MVHMQYILFSPIHMGTGIQFISENMTRLITDDEIYLVKLLHSILKPHT